MKSTIKSGLVLFSFMMALTMGVAFADKEIAANATQNATMENETLTNVTMENETLGNDTLDNATLMNATEDNSTMAVVPAASSATDKK